MWYVISKLIRKINTDICKPIGTTGKSSIRPEIYRLNANKHASGSYAYLLTIGNFKALLPHFCLAPCSYSIYFVWSERCFLFVSNILIRSCEHICMFMRGGVCYTTDLVCTYIYACMFVRWSAISSSLATAKRAGHSHLLAFTIEKSLCHYLMMWFRDMDFRLWATRRGGSHRGAARALSTSEVLPNNFVRHASNIVCDYIRFWFFLNVYSKTSN